MCVECGKIDGCGPGKGQAEQHYTLLQKPRVYCWFYSQTRPSWFPFCLCTCESCCVQGKLNNTVRLCSNLCILYKILFTVQPIQHSLPASDVISQHTYTTSSILLLDLPKCVRCPCGVAGGLRGKCSGHWIHFFLLLFLSFSISLYYALLLFSDLDLT